MAQAYFKIVLDNGTTPLTLTNNPAGIEDFSVTYKRHITYGTVFRSVGDSLRFVKEGKEYIKAVFDSSGIDGECDIDISTINLENKTYTSIYTGIIDFTSYSEDIDYVEVGIIDSSIMAKFLAREETEVNLLDTVNMDGETITNTMPSRLELELPPINPIYWSLSNGLAFRDHPTSSIPLTGANPLIFVDNFSGNTSFNNIGSDWNNSTLIYTNNNSLSVNSIFKFDIEIVLTGSITITKWVALPPPDPDPSFTIIYQVYRNDTGAIYKQYSQTVNSVGTFPISYSFSETNQFNSVIAPGGTQGFTFVIQVSSNGGTANIEGSYSFEHDTALNECDFQYTDPNVPSSLTTKVLAYKPLDVGNILLEQMGINSVTTPFESGEFDSGDDYEFLLLTNGKSIRQFPSDTPVNISFRDFFKSYSSMLGLLFAYNESEFRFENTDYYYDPLSTGLTITEHSDLVIEIANDKYFNGIDIGYENESYEDINGNVEFNTKFNYSTINKNIDSTKDKISPFRADSLGIELLRRMDYQTTGGEDNDSDNDTFVISSLFDTGESYYRPELGSDFTITGLRGSDNYYNYRITPKSNLVRNGFYLNTTLKYNPKEVKYIRSKNNIPLIIDGLPELDGDYNETETGDLFPVYISFKTILTDDILTFLRTTPNEKITLTGVGTGFLEQADVNLYKKEITIKMVKYS